MTTVIQVFRGKADQPPRRVRVPLARLLGSICLLAVAVAPTQAEDAKPAEPPPAKELQVAAPQAKDSMIVVVGAQGADEFGTAFSEWAERWREAAAAAEIKIQTVGLEAAGEPNDHEALRRLLAENATACEAPLWLVLIGHGTYDRDTAKFNLRGPDVSAPELADWLAAVERPLIVINSASSSGPFINSLHGAGRVVITATSSGSEQNFARFGDYLSAAWNDLDADLDHDDQVSLLEAFLLASGRVARFYEDNSRLATEHALLEDNADGKGTPADFFVGIRATKKSRDGAAADGRLAHRYILLSAPDAPRLTPEQLRERDRLETAIETLRDRKSLMSADDYYSQLEPLLIEMARLYAE